MLNPDGTVTDWKTVNENFAKKNYNEKKEEILAYLTNKKGKKLMKKAEKNLEEEFIIEDAPEEGKEGDRTGIYIVVVISVIVIVMVIGGIMYMKEQKKE